MTKIFPIILMVLDLAAALGYACGCDWKRTIYDFLDICRWFNVSTHTIYPDMEGAARSVSYGIPKYADSSL